VSARTDSAQSRRHHIVLCFNRRLQTPLILLPA
jgi:hypothetical protein